MLSLYSFCSLFVCVRVRVCGICSRINVGYIPNLPPLQRYDLSLPCSCVLCRVLLRWINTYYLCAVCRVRAWQCFSRVEVWHILLCLIVFIQSLMFRYAHLGYNVIIYGHYIDILCYCVLIQQADFLLVYNYTLSNRLRDKELGIGVSGNVADLAHFYA